MFLLIAALSFLGGCLYPPLNYDANAYRLPRVMHWLWAGQWAWIHVFDARMNIAACGMEWLSAPLILFSHTTDRLLFLINWVSYLMLPGLLFSVFTRLQVRRALHSGGRGCCRPACALPCKPARSRTTVSRPFTFWPRWIWPCAPAKRTRSPTSGSLCWRRRWSTECS